MFVCMRFGIIAYGCDTWGARHGGGGEGEWVGKEEWIGEGG